MHSHATLGPRQASEAGSHAPGALAMTCSANSCRVVAPGSGSLSSLEQCTSLALASARRAKQPRHRPGAPESS
eukprot:4392497-Alexandrium_andersonii.AAC.1